MAIWPFGRKGKRPRSQLTGSETADKVFSLHGSEQALTGEKPSHKRSKREKNHPSRSLTGDYSYTFQDPAPWLSRRTPSSIIHETFSPGEIAPNPTHVRSRSNHNSSFSYTFINQTSVSSIDQDNIIAPRPVLLPVKRSSNAEKGALKKKLSKRSAREIAREQEVRLMSSPPLDYKGRVGKYHTWSVTRRPSILGRHTDRRTSQLSLSLRGSAHSSLSEGSDSYTFKLNSFSVFTPWPVIRFRQSHRSHQESTSVPTRKDKQLIIQAEDVRSRRRVAELADDLDAPALRELLERDRRRKEKKRLEDLEKLQRRLQRRAERQQVEEIRGASLEGQHAGKGAVPDERGRSHFSVSTTPASQVQQDDVSGRIVVREVKTQSGSWFRDSSKDSDTPSNRMSEGSANVIGNIDDRSIREGNSGQHYGVGSLQDQRRLQSTLSSSLSPDDRFRGNTSTSQFTSLGLGSGSDISRTYDKRVSDNSVKRKAAWSFFGRGAARRKGDSGDHAQERLSELSNTSGESFSRIYSNPGPPPNIPERSFLRTGTSRRTQSKFKEHLGDYPNSPSDSRVQSPTFGILETTADISPLEEKASGMDEQGSSISPISFAAEPERVVESTSRHLSWETSDARASPENGFSQSLASIDSEGSWMSGKYLRSISRATNPSIRRSVGSTTNRLEEYAESKGDEDVASDEYLTRLTSGTREQHDSPADGRRASSSAMGIDNDRQSDNFPAPEPITEPDESWNSENSRPSMLVQQPKSHRNRHNGLRADGTTPSDDVSPIEEITPVEIERATSIDFGRGHARHISAGSAKLLDIPARVSIDSKSLSIH